MKRRLFALLVGVMTAITAGCAPATGAACLRRLYAWELSTLNYLITSRSHELSFAANCIGTLVEYDAYGILGPGLAESWLLSIGNVKAAVLFSKDQIGNGLLMTYKV